MPRFLSVGLFVIFSNYYISWAFFKIEISKWAQMCSSEGEKRLKIFVLISQAVSIWRPFKIFNPKFHENRKYKENCFYDQKDRELKSKSNEILYVKIGSQTTELSVFFYIWLRNLIGLPYCS
jgi:hypothetical protein